MRQLFWKEWHELKWLPVGGAALFSLIVLGYIQMSRLPSMGMRAKDLRSDDALILLWAIWCLFGVMAGAGLFAQETGAGTLSFLLSLPKRRGKIWLVKVAAGAGSLIQTFISTGLVWLILRYTLLSSTDTSGWSATIISTDTSGWSATITLPLDRVPGSGIAILAACVCYSVAAAASAVVDRYLSAAMIALVISVLLAVVTGWVSSSLAWLWFIGQTSVPLLAFCFFIAVWVVIPLVASYHTFCKGDIAARTRRIRVACAWLGVALAATTILILATSYANERAAIPMQRHM